MCRAIERRHRQRVGNELGHVQLLNRRLGIICRIGPVTGRIDRQVTVSTINSGGLKRRLARVRIGNRQ